MKDKDKDKAIEDTLKQIENERLRQLYSFLLSKTYLKKSSSQENEENISDSFIAKQWGVGNYRVLIQRVLESLGLRGEHTNVSSWPDPPGLDLYKLVRILHALDEYHVQSFQQGENVTKSSKIRFTVADKIEALRLYSELSSFERNYVGLPLPIEKQLTIHMNEILADPSNSVSEDLIHELYKTILSKFLSTSTNSTQLTYGNSDDIDSWIREEIKKLLSIYCPELGIPSLISNDHPQLAYRFNAVRNELERMFLQCGYDQSLEFSNTNRPPVEITRDNFSTGSLASQNISTSLLAKLTHAVFRNSLISDKMPIFIKYITVERLRPLPLKVHSESSKDGLLDEELSINSEGEKIDIEGFSRQVALHVRVHFRINMNENSSESIEFHQETSGIGSPISLAMSIIDRVLLWDIPCLRKLKIYHTTKQTFLQEQVIERTGNSYIWAHSLVELCYIDEIEDKLNNKDNSRNLRTAKHSGRADFCGFDLLDTVIKASLNARLDALINLGVDSERYVREICDKIRDAEILQSAQKSFRSYPFSYWVMSGKLAKLLNREEWSLVIYDAHLSLAEILLIEGKFLSAGKILKNVKRHIDADGISTNLVKATFFYLEACYYYLYANNEDDENNILDNKNHSRHSAIREMRDKLSNAKYCIRTHFKFCEVIGESANANVHPVFNLIGKINFLEAQLNLFFGQGYLPENTDYASSLNRVFVSLQSARICAARNGSTVDYACYTAFQSWLYLLMTYMDDYDLYARSLLHLTRQECEDWSARLLRHSMICYSSEGMKSYVEIKSKAGSSEESDGSENTISPIPFIKEHQKEYPLDLLIDEISSIDILNIPFFPDSLYSFDGNLKDQPSVYLFGPQACILLLSYSIHGLHQIGEHGDKTEELNKHHTEKAMRLAISSWSIARDGGSSQDINGNRVHLERSYVPSRFDTFGTSAIRGLYPHRISHVVPWSALVIVVCKLLLVMQDYPEYLHGNKDWNQLVEEEHKLEELFTDILGDLNECKNRGGKTQKRLNVHLEEHFNQANRYYKNIEAMLKNKTWGKDRNGTYPCTERSHFNQCYVNWRNILLRDFFRIIINASTETPLNSGDYEER